MMHTNLTRALPNQSSAPVRALHSLTRRDADAVRATVRQLGGEWLVEQHDDYDGYLSLLLTPEASEDRPAFLVSGRTGAVELAELRGDDMTSLGCFRSIGAATAVLAEHLGIESWAAQPARARATGPATANDAPQLIARHGDEADLHAAMLADRAFASGNRVEARGWTAVLRALDEVTRAAPARC